MVQRGGGSGSGDGISWQVDMMRSAAWLNQVLTWETLWMGKGRVYLVLDVWDACETWGILGGNSGSATSFAV